VKFGADGKSGHGLQIAEYQTPEAVDCNPKITDVDESCCGSVQEKDAGTKKLGTSSSVSAGKKSISANVVMRGCSSGISEKVSTSGSGVQQQLHRFDLVQKNASHAENGVTSSDRLMHGCTNNIAAKSTNLHADLRSNIETRSEKPALHVRPSNNKPADVSVNQYVRGSRKFETSGTSYQRKIFSARDMKFLPMTIVRQYRPKNSGGSRTMSVAPSTKPRPQWCSTGLTHTQKRRVQRLRVSEIREEIAQKKSYEWLNKDRPMVLPMMTWKEKRIIAKENKNMDDMVPDGISENTSDTPTDLDIDKGG
jgi:hypothetical protein